MLEVRTVQVRISDKPCGVIGIVGHVGVGHVHSHMGFVQDDSGGFAVATSLLQRALPVNLRIKAVECDVAGGTVTVVTEDGGVGRASARRGITPAEAALMQAAAGKDAVFTQSIAVSTFGRMYGQGVTETPVAFQTAIALALVDTFARKYPESVRVVGEDMPGRVGKVLGAVIEIEGTPVSLLAVVNASEGGLGPNEDLEGNVMLGAKGELMKELSFTNLPTIIIEGKMFVPKVSEGIKERTFWIRAQEEVDNTTVAASLVQAAAELGLPHLYSRDVLPQIKDTFRQATRALGQRIVDIGERLKKAELAEEKVALIAELAVIVSQDAGGVTFMSNPLQEVARSAGLVPGTAAVLSLLVTPEEKAWWKIPQLTPEDVEDYLRIVMLAVGKLSGDLGAARDELARKYRWDEYKWEQALDPSAL